MIQVKKISKSLIAAEEYLKRRIAFIKSKEHYERNEAAYLINREKFLKATVRASNDVNDLTGFGIEYLMDSNGNNIARFDNGVMTSSIRDPRCSKEESEEPTIPTL